MDFNMNKVLFVVKVLELYCNCIDTFRAGIDTNPGENLFKKRKRKIPTEVGIIIMDGLVSTGK